MLVNYGFMYKYSIDSFIMIILQVFQALVNDNDEAGRINKIIPTSTRCDMQGGTKLWEILFLCEKMGGGPMLGRYIQVQHIRTDYLGFAVEKLLAWEIKPQN